MADTHARMFFVTSQANSAVAKEDGELINDGKGLRIGSDSFLNLDADSFGKIDREKLIAPYRPRIKEKISAVMTGGASRSALVM